MRYRALRPEYVREAMNRCSLLGVAAFAMTFSAGLGPLCAQAGMPRRVVMPKAIANDLPVAAAQDRVLVKLVEGRPELVRDRRIVDASIREVLGGRQVRPFFERQERELAALRARQLASLPDGARPAVDFGLYFEVTTTGGHDSRALVRALNELAVVELAYVRSLPAPPPGVLSTEAARPFGDIPPTTPDFTTFQGHRMPAPSGVDAAALLFLTGGSGNGIRVVDVEYGWQLQHEDISALRPSSNVGLPFGGFYEDHGTAVAGIIAADPDRYGVTGLAPDVEFYVSTSEAFGWPDVAGAILTGLTVLSAGDVLLIEQQIAGPIGFLYLPVEWDQLIYDAIETATGLGIIVVEAAGNGSVDLDHPQLGGLFNRNVRDSGAIVVAASGAGIASRANFSNYGSRIDCNGWGYWVTTAGYGTMFDPGDPRQLYASGFGGTSSASAIVTGVVAGLRGAAVAQLDPAAAAALDGAAIRSLLQTTGTPTIPIIGNRPDAAELLAATGIARGLKLRGEPRTGLSSYVDLVPPFSAGANDLWSFLGSVTPDNQPLYGWSGRILLATPVVPLGLGGFSAAAPTASLTVPIPADPSLEGLRFHVQGFSYEAATGQLYATNSVQVLVRR